MRTSKIALTAGALLAGSFVPALAATGDQVALHKCEQSYGTVAVVEGDTQGWTAYGLGSPRELIRSLALESGCFTPQDAAGGAPADFLMNVVAGDSEEVDKSIELAKTAAIEGLVRSGAAANLLSRVPGGGALFGMVSAFGGKKKVVAAGIKLISPANGLAVATGSGQVKKTSIDFRGGHPWAAGAAASGYAASKDGKMLVEAFIKAFNAVSAQGAAIAAAVPRAPAPESSAGAVAAAAPEAAGARVAVDTVLRADPSITAAEVRALRAGTGLVPSGRREGLFIEVNDSYGTTGWVSVEDLD